MSLKFTKPIISDQLDILEPFLLIDSIKIDIANQKAIAKRAIDHNDWFFSCHLPKTQVMPATLIIEGMLQTMAMLIYKSIDHKFNRAYIVDIRSKLLASITPKDKEIIYTATLISSKRGITKGYVDAKYKDEKKSEGNFIYASPHLMNIPSNTI
ncbi:FabA/FabZ family ACP-dehydratase [Prochlorococcus marinus]|uniref:FabA/FabZ family ACP-dehydratase n=1 Tax=Prochlorococcus marinus TaxID=1219 RepID=UPI0022B55E2D|nr:FabA/FabZ family ACP-dehydratase [Prochlorococcus marinus]